MLLRAIVLVLASLSGFRAEPKNETLKLEIHCNVGDTHVKDVDLNEHMNMTGNLRFDPDSHSRWGGTLHMNRSSIVSVDRRATVVFTDGASTTSGTMILNGTVIVSGSVSLATPIIMGPESLINVSQGAVLQVDAVSGHGEIFVAGALNGTMISSPMITVEDTLSATAISVMGSLTMTPNATLFAETLIMAPGGHRRRRLLAPQSAGSCRVASLYGSGDLGCDVHISETLDPTGTLSIASLIQDPASTALFTVPGDLVMVLGSVNLSGTLRVEFSGTPLDAIIVMGESISGSYTSVLFSGLPSGMSAQIVQTSTRVSVSVAAPDPTGTPDPDSLPVHAIIGVLAGLAGISFIAFLVQRRIARRPVDHVDTSMQNPLYSNV
jgi:hypothetical protein